ncbi:MAG: serine hydrolase [Candidatus Eremiobacteraeota bacterium]|nr:serine hydrolase [Candidatus Eremiobacteraeota bacterium]MBV9700411.1 serine hydrolase [Candidatus Eremiobacteraeota bacterium]
MTSRLETDVERAVADWPVVGLGCSVIAEGQTLFTRGFGRRSVQGNQPADDRTLFAIGSASKAFTGAAIAMLVDEGLISWDSRVLDHLRNFRLFDPYVTREMTVRDLLTHRSGLERGDFMWYKSGYDAADVLRRLAYLEPSWSFRTTFGYQNVMYLAAGELITTLTHQTWDDFIRERIFSPLGMEESRPSLATLDQGGNVARPHARINGTITEIAAHDGLNMNPAGSIYSNARDMLAWMRLAIEGGVLDGKRLLSTGSSRMTHTPQMIIAHSAWSEMFPEAEFLSYAAGWFVCAYRGLTLVSHGGNVDGMTAVVAVIPEKRFGITALANVGSSRLPQALVYHAIDTVILERASSWLQRFHESERFAHDRLDYIDDDRKRSTVAGAAPSRPLDAYAGTYHDDFYGTATVRYYDGHLHLSFVGFDGPLEHWHFDSFKVSIEDPYLRTYASVARFDLDDYGEPSQLTLVVLGALRMKLQRKPAEPKAIALPLEELRRFQGRFVSKPAALEVSVDVVDGGLKITVPGSVAASSEDYVVRALVPTAPSRFAVASTKATLRFESYEEVTLEIPHQLPTPLRRA